MTLPDTTSNTPAQAKSVIDTQATPRHTFRSNGLHQLIPYAVTILLVLVAGWLTSQVWHLYMHAPWTRDASVRVNVTQIAPEGVSGYVVDLPLTDNQWVNKGDLLFRLDSTRYQLALNEAQAALEVAQATAELDRSFAQSRIAAGNAVSGEERALYINRAKTSELEIKRLEATVATAQFNLSRTEIRAPVDGYVTNLNLRPGNFLESGQTAVILLDQQSFWVEAYFQETKIGSVTAGDKAAIQFMAYDRPIQGTVMSVARGIANTNNDAGPLGLQNINPVDAWVRLAQRIPVYIRIDERPSDLPLAAGMTASVAVGTAAEQTLNPTSFSDRLQQWFATHL